jgi:hypothetical protein
MNMVLPASVMGPPYSPRNGIPAPVYSHFWCWNSVSAS